MKIVIGTPPNYDLLVEHFPWIIGKETIFFTWGQTIYTLTEMKIPPEIMCHEAVHAQHQGSNDDEIRAWWDRYLVDPLFRFEEEALAHRAEYRAFKGMVKDHRRRFDMLHNIAERLASPMYGNLVTYADARHAILVDVYDNKLAKLRREGATA